MPEPLLQELSAGGADHGNTQNYDRYLWQRAVSEAWSFVLEKNTRAIVFANAIFMVTTFVGFYWWGADTFLRFGGAVLAGLTAIALTYGVVVAVHLLYLTPRKLMARKQDQVTTLRSTVGAKETEVLVLKRLLARKTVARHERDKQQSAT